MSEFYAGGGMSEQEQQYAQQIWPQHMQPRTLDTKLQAAKAWLGDRYLLSQPVNRKRK